MTDAEKIKALLDRPPECGWDCAVDLRQAKKYLRDTGDIVGEYELEEPTPGAHFAKVKKYEDDLTPYIVKLRGMGIRRRTVVGMIQDHFKTRLQRGAEIGFDIDLIRSLAKRIYIESTEPPGRDSAAGARVPDGMNFEKDSRGLPQNTPGNIGVAFVRLGVSLRYDKFADKYLIEGLKDFGPELNDAAVNRLRFDIEQKYRFFPSRELMFDFCYDFARYYTFDPVCDYFDRLEWDGTPRINRFLIDYAKAEDTLYVRAVSALLFLAVVRRNRQPGAKFDEMIVLESPQGMNKSSALAVLAMNEKWFTDSFPLNSDNRETLEHAQGKIIIEVAELQGMRKADREHVKAMLSRTTDRGRLAYARTQSEAPRRFIFVGTSNGSDYLQDETGNRRFWPVEVQAFDLDKLRADRDQLWAEAAARDELGDAIRLDPALWKAAAIEQEARLAINSDPFTEELDDHLGGRTGRIASGDVWTLLSIDAGRRTPELNRRMGAAMRAIGWKRYTIKLDHGRNAERVAGYGKGKDSRRLVVHKGPDRRLYVSCENHPATESEFEV